MAEAGRYSTSVGWSGALCLAIYWTARFAPDVLLETGLSMRESDVSGLGNLSTQNPVEGLLPGNQLTAREPKLRLVANGPIAGPRHRAVIDDGTRSHRSGPARRR
jgi:hypothetical protein